MIAVARWLTMLYDARWTTQGSRWISLEHQSVDETLMTKR
jgi:hypothetical protein